MTNTIIEVKVLFSYELAPLPTSLFDEFGEIRVDKSKANISKSDVVVLDCCTTLCRSYPPEVSYKNVFW